MRSILEIATHTALLYAVTIACAHSSKEMPKDGSVRDVHSAVEQDGKMAEDDVADADISGIDSSMTAQDSESDVTVSTDTSIFDASDRDSGIADAETDVASDADIDSSDDWRNEFEPCPLNNACGYYENENCPASLPTNLSCDANQKDCLYCVVGANTPTLLAYCLGGTWEHEPMTGGCGESI